MIYHTRLIQSFSNANPRMVCMVHSAHINLVFICMYVCIYVANQQQIKEDICTYFICMYMKGARIDRQRRLDTDTDTDDVPFWGQPHGYAGAFLCILGWTQQRRKKISHWCPGATLLRPLPRQRLCLFSHFHLSPSW